MNHEGEIRSITALFSEPGTQLAFVNDVHGPRFCLAVGQNVRCDTNVGLRLNQLVYIDGERFVNTNHAFRAEARNHQIPYNQLNGHRIWIPEDVVEFMDRQSELFTFANCT